MNRFEAHDIARARRMELTERIQRFIDGSDTSQASAALIEAGLDDAFPDNDAISEMVLKLANYRPGGGAQLHDEQAIQAELAKVLPRIR